MFVRDPNDFLFRFIGVILGALLAVIAFIAVYKIERQMKSPWQKVFPIAMALILLLRYSGIAVKLMLARRKAEKEKALRFPV